MVEVLSNYFVLPSNMYIYLLNCIMIISADGVAVLKEIFKIVQLSWC